MLVPMYTFIRLLMHIFGLLLDLLATCRLSDPRKDMEILLLRQQLRILQRKSPHTPHVSPWQKSILAMLAVQFKALTRDTGHGLDEVMLLFKPDTVLRWHRELVRRKWTFRRDRRGGRPPVAAELQEQIVRLATENPRWGYSKIQGNYSSSDTRSADHA
jgi:putative transposase